MGGNTLTGGRRRGSRAKRSSRNSRVAKGKKVMRGGAFYEFGGALDGTGAGARWGGVDNLAANPVTGQLIRDGGEMQAPKIGGRRRRTGKKGTRKSRRVTRRRRTMRGGNPLYHGSANSGVSFDGTGVAGTRDPVGYAANVPGAGSTHFQTAGVWNA